MNLSSKSEPTNNSNPTAKIRGRWFWQRSLRNRILLTYGALSITTLLLLVFYVSGEVYELQLEQAEHDLEVSAFLIANALEDPLSGYPQALGDFGTIDIDAVVEEAEIEESVGRALLEPAVEQSAERDISFQEFVQLNTRGEEARVTLLSIHGDVIADSLSTDVELPSQREFTEVNAALHGEEQHEIRRDAQSGVRTLYAAAPVQQGRRLLGVVRLSRPMSEVLMPTRLFLLNLIAGSLLALVGVLVIGMALSRYLVRPLQKLEESANQVASGDLTLRVPVERVDEVGALAVSFNTMVFQLRTLIDKQRHFVTNASHELRTPLTNIKLRSEAILAMNEPLSPRAQRYITEIDQEADRLRRLANTLLNMASAEQSGPSETVEKELAPLLLTIARSFRMTARQHDIRLQARVPEVVCPLRIWPDHLVIIVNNLLDNAIKYTPSGGEVFLDIHQEQGQLVIEIRDNGPGIPAEDLPHIFERFYRVDKARSRQSAGSSGGSGAGLGLAIVQNLIELNGGTIAVISTLGEGTTFTLRFSCVGSDGSIGQGDVDAGNG